MKTATILVGFYSDSSNEELMELLTGLRNRRQDRRCIVNYSIPSPDVLVIHNIEPHMQPESGINPYRELCAMMPITGTVRDCGSGELRVLSIHVDNLLVSGICPSIEYWNKIQQSRQIRSTNTAQLLEVIINPKGNWQPA